MLKKCPECKNPMELEETVKKIENNIIGSTDGTKDYFVYKCSICKQKYKETFKDYVKNSNFENITA